MNHKIRVNTLCLLFPLLLVSCEDQKAKVILYEAEKVVDIQPQLTIDILNSADSSLFASRKRNAQKSLLYSQALENCGSVVDYSTLQPAFMYYSKPGKPIQKRAYVWYAMGKAQMDEGKNVSSLVSLMKAHSLCKGKESGSFRAKLLLAMGDNYSKSFLYEEALPLYRQAIGSARLIKDTNLIISATYAEARTLNNLSCFPQADSVFRSLLLQQYMDPSMFYRIMADYALMAVEHEHDYIIGQIYYNKAISGTHSFGSYNHWGAYAYALEQTGNSHEADMLMQQLTKKQKDSLYSIMVWKSRIMAHRHDFKGAYEMMEQASAVRTDNFRAVLRKSALRAHGDFYEQAYENTRRENRLSKILMVFIFLLSASSIHIVCSYLRRKHEAARLREESLVETANLLSSQLDDLQKERISLQENFVKIHQNHLKEFGSLLRTTLGSNESNIGFKQIKLYEKAELAMNSIMKDQQGKTAFEDRLNECFDDVMKHLRTELLNHTDDYYRFAGFVFAGFDNETLMAITGTKSLDSIYAKKRRLKQDILHSEVPHKDLFMRLMR